MKVRSGLLVLFLAVLVVGAGAACSSGGKSDSSLRGYFEEYERIDNAAESRTEQLQTEYTTVLAATSLNDETRTGLKEYFEKQVAARREYLDGISDLNPPKEAAAAHNESVTSYEAVLTAFEPVLTELETASNIADLDRIFSGQELTDAIAKANESCRALQTIADDKDININLECS